MNNNAARNFCWTPSILQSGYKIEEKHDDNDPFFIVWLELIQKIQPTSIKILEDLKLAIKNCHPS
jgi:hypothetical protein